MRGLSSAKASLPAREALKICTKKVHEELEKKNPLQGELDRGDLSAYLLRLRQWLSPIEQALYGVGRHWPLELDEKARSSKVEWIDEDLSALGMSPEELARLPRVTKIGFSTPAEAGGALYVVEGMTLGGRLLRRRLENQNLPVRFFEGYQDQTKRHWLTSIELLEALGKEPLALDDMKESALATFTSFGEVVLGDGRHA